MSDHISVVLADDHAIVRKSLAERLAREPDIKVVGTAEDAESAIAAAVNLQADVLVMDIDMPGRLCFDAAKTIQIQSRKVRIVFLSAFSNDAYVDQALAVEAAGYVTKDETPETVADAIRAAATGRRFFSPQIQRRIVVDSDGVRLARKERSRASTLTPRELEVLRHISRGMSQKEIAQAMHVSADTVHCHVANLRKKLEIRDRVALARFAIREGLAEA